MNSKNEPRLKIGLLVSHLDDAFDDAVCEGAMIAAKQKNVDLVIFPGRYIDAEYADKLRTEYEYQYNTVFDMAADNKFDLLLVLLGTIASNLDLEGKKRFLKKFDGTPVITIASPVEGYPCIMVDNKAGMISAVQHLVEEHNCRRIGFVSGPRTSSDALERLDAYKEVLLSHGIEYDENRVVYGNFSKYCSEQIEELFDRCHDLDAVVFANDQMALAGYQVMNKRGIRPGIDMLVTGFDNDPVSMEMAPHLTTVESDPSELGYTALIESIDYLKNGRLANDKVPATLICRESCGCKEMGRLEAFENDCDLSREEISQRICDYLLNQYRNSDISVMLRNKLNSMILRIHELITSSRLLDTAECEKVMMFCSECADPVFFRFIDIYKLYSAIEYLQNIMYSKMEGSEMSFALNKLFIRLFRIMAEKNSAYCAERLEDAHFLTWQTNAIARDMLVFEAYDDLAYHSVVDKLPRLHITSSYLYSYDNAIINRKTDTWKFPEIMKLKAYHNRSDAILLPPEKQNIVHNEIFSNEYMPRDRRYTIVASAIFTNEEHYGILLCEVEHDDFRCIQSVTGQLCAAMKIITLMKQQQITQRQLQQSLIEIKENNQLLSDISKQDELTGCYNRRGFFEEVRKKLNERQGTDAVMIFADLDSLKTINDRFGHEEGDFAICSAAAILRKAFGNNEIVGRIGGDEFAVCAFPDEEISVDEIAGRINAITDEYNKENCAQRPYLVHTSVGAYPFKCTEEVEIGELLSHADVLLYEQKRNKRSILK